jgi:hypothetical protein
MHRARDYLDHHLLVNSTHSTRDLELIGNNWRVVSIRKLKLSVIVVLILLTFPFRLDGWQGGAAIAATTATSDRPGCPFIVGAGKWTCRGYRTPSVGNNIKYKCTDCTDCSPSFLTQTDYGPYPN